MKSDENTLLWLLQGDPSIRYQTLRDLTDADKDEIDAERQQISSEGWGARLLSFQDDSGLWSGALYSPKWISTTYTMLLLRRMGLDTDNPRARKGCKLLLDRGYYPDGGINYFVSLNHSETCVTGMILSLLAYFKIQDDRIHRLVDHLLHQQMEDGGWNCQSYKGATHSSFHTTINVLEGLREYDKSTISGKRNVTQSQKQGCEFLLVHRLFRSHRSGEVFDPRMTRFSFPPRWKYDILRALDYMQDIRLAHDNRLNDALKIVRRKLRQDGTWLLQNRHPGRTFFELEKVGEPSRWNTLRAMRVLRWFEKDARKRE